MLQLFIMLVFFDFLRNETKKKRNYFRWKLLYEGCKSRSQASVAESQHVDAVTGKKIKAAPAPTLLYTVQSQRFKNKRNIVEACFFYRILNCLTFYYCEWKNN
jgi:hypothetical protein